MKRSALRRSGGSPQPSSVASRSATWRATAPSGWPTRGSPQASPVSRSGDRQDGDLEIVLGHEAGKQLHDGSGELLDPGLGGGHPWPLYPERYSIRSITQSPFPVRARTTRARARPLAHRDHVGTILLHARPVIDEHQVQALVLDVGPLRFQGFARGVLEQRPIPALVLRAGRLERAVGVADALPEPGSWLRRRL